MKGNAMQEQLPKVICGAKTRSGEPCQTSPVSGRHRCRMHGGTIRRGIASPHFVHGRYSKVLPTRLAERYAECFDDPELLSLRSEIALVDARLLELLDPIHGDEQGSDKIMTALLDEELVAAHRRNDEQAVRAVEQRIMPYLKNVLGRHQIIEWHNIIPLLEVRRKLCESEQKRLMSARLMVSADQAGALMQAVVSVIRQEVTDPQMLYRIAEGISHLMERSGEGAY